MQVSCDMPMLVKGTVVPLIANADTGRIEKSVSP